MAVILNKIRSITDAYNWQRSSSAYTFPISAETTYATLKANGITFLGVLDAQESTYSGFYPKYYNAEALDTQQVVRFLVEATANTVEVNINYLLKLFLTQSTEVVYNQYAMCGVMQAVEKDMITANAYYINITLIGQKLSEWNRVALSTTATSINNLGAAPSLVDVYCTGVNNTQGGILLGTKHYNFNNLVASHVYQLDSQNGVLYDITTPATPAVVSAKYVSNTLPQIEPGSVNAAIDSTATNLSNVVIYYRARFI